mmetsp:Transcript_142753/g.397643  ORF Transcript_142753/g.397643 Transcript_142753/m.397643 type:complete len:540 (-) Transcript_142753:180-1799(-)
MGDGRAELAIAETGGALATRNRRAEIESLQQQKVLDTPRTREACRRLGLVLEDLQYRTPDSFANPGDLKEKVQLRYDHHEKRRKERLAQVLAERAKVIAQNAKKGEVPGVQSGQFLSMLESLFEKEAKRLESDLKGQLRQHSALVRENEDQLRKEEQLQADEKRRRQRREASQKQFQEAGNRAKQRLEDRQAHNADILAKLDEDFREKQISHARALLAEEERMERFMTEKEALSNDKSALFREKVERIKEKNQQMALERRIEGENKLMEIEMRINQVHARRDEEQKRRQMQSEEQHLHLMDVREQKSRIDRVDGYRRDELREQIDSNVERIETLLALKDQLLDQRRDRNAKAAATKGSRGLNLRRDCAPGPGQYESAPSTLMEVPGGKIGRAQVPGMLDDAIRGTSKNPAPGSYDTSLLANGDRVDKACPNMGKFGNRDRDSFLDDAIKAKDHIPAPGRYQAKSQLDHRGTEMRRDRVQDTGIEKTNKKNFPVWARPATDTPGPAGYSVDDYTRKEVLRRAQKSLPNLTRDMLRTGVPV